MRYVIHDKTTGEIIRQGVVTDGSNDHLKQVRDPNHAVIVPPKGVPVDDSKHMIDVATGAIIPIPPPPAEVQAAKALETLRRKRNALLFAADHTQFAHVPMDPAKRAAWATYMQALRDLPATDLTNVKWPTPPSQET